MGQTDDPLEPGECVGRHRSAVSQALLDAGYTIVDVSIEPLDGGNSHSGRTVVRGTLPW